MKINNVYIGGWFQRTMLQLSEIYDFLREATTKLALDQDKLIEYRKNLQSVELIMVFKVKNILNLPRH